MTAEVPPAAALAVTVNGAPRALPAGATVDTLLTVLDVIPRGVAVERNRAIVPKSLYAATALEDGDAIEIVSFVGGG